jgi:hypothetical protein
MSITVSVTLPDRLEKDLQNAADVIGISRSRYIANLLLEWQAKTNKSTNKCEHQNNRWCDFFQLSCILNQEEALNCKGYYEEAI